VTEVKNTGALSDGQGADPEINLLGGIRVGTEVEVGIDRLGTVPKSSSFNVEVLNPSTSSLDAGSSLPIQRREKNREYWMFLSLGVCGPVSSVSERRTVVGITGSLVTGSQLIHL
jgi:hypothetical protein